MINCEMDYVKDRLSMRYLSYILENYKIRAMKDGNGYQVELYNDKDSRIYYGNNIEDVLILVGGNLIKGILKEGSY